MPADWRIDSSSLPAVHPYQEKPPPELSAQLSAGPPPSQPAPKNNNSHNTALDPDGLQSWASELLESRLTCSASGLQES